MRDVVWGGESRLIQEVYTGALCYLSTISRESRGRTSTSVWAFREGLILLLFSPPSRPLTRKIRKNEEKQDSRRDSGWLNRKKSAVSPLRITGNFDITKKDERISRDSKLALLLSFERRIVLDFPDEYSLDWDVEYRSLARLCPWVSRLTRWRSEVQDFISNFEPCKKWLNRERSGLKLVS